MTNVLPTPDAISAALDGLRAKLTAVRDSL
jgi:hypothetical protein